MLEGSGWKVDVVLGRFQVNWGSAPLQIVTLWSIMVVLWKKRHKICLLSVNERAILRSFHRKRAIFLVVGRHFCMRTCSNTVVDVVWTGEWVHWDRHTLSASWYFFFFHKIRKRNNSDVWWTKRSTCQSNWVVVVVIKMVGEICIDADWAKKWSEQARKCVARLNVWFRSNCIFRRVVEHVEKLLTTIFRLLLSAERLFWGWNTKWVLVGWFVPKEEAWQAWMRFSRLFAYRWECIWKSISAEDGMSQKMNENIVIFLVFGAW